MTHSPPTGSCPHSLEDVDLFEPGAQEHWYAAYDILHDKAPVHCIPNEGSRDGTDGFILSKYEDIVKVVSDVKRFPYPSSAVVDKKAPAEDELAISMNAMMVSIASLRPTDDLWRIHRRQLTDPWFGPGASRHKDMIKQAVNELIDQWIDNGKVEFVEEFAAPLPQIVMTKILGFPLEDMPKLRAWGEEQVRRYVYGRGHRNLLSPEEEENQTKVLDEFSEYLAKHLTEKRSNPQDDMISWLSEVTYQPLERKLTDIEIIGVIYAMHLGGLETTQYAIAEQAQLLCETPGLFETLKSDPKKIRFFCEEGLRLRAPTQGLSTRMTTQDEVFQGVKVSEGSILHLRWAAANLDPDVYECPKDLDLNRKRATRHLTFSNGLRSCPGSGLSRLEQNIAWETLLMRLDSIAYAEDVSITHQPGIMLGTKEVKLVFEKAKTA